jgi:hypothetical protein
VAHLAKFSGTYVDLSPEMGAQDNKNPRQFKN